MKKTKANIFFIGTVFLLFTITSACSKTDKSALFQQKLYSIDAAIQEGNGQKVLDRLRTLRKKAELPIQYLSIAKRELRLHASVQAIQSIQEGLKKYPDDAALKAALTHTLLQEKMLDDAAAAAETLLGSPYAGIGAEAFIRSDNAHKTCRTPVAFWKEGFRLTGGHRFLENAAALLAYQGDIPAAAALRSAIGKKEALQSPYFWSCLAYDAGNFKPVLDDLVYTLAYADIAGVPEHNQKAFEYARRHLLLAADASAGLRDTEQARGFWQMYIDRYPNFSGNVFYNLAMTAPTQEERVRILIECITQDPGYYPAVAQYVRACAAINAANAEKNSLTEYLQSKNFFSLEMEKTLFVSSAFTLSAEQVLEDAVAANKTDLRFLLENFRYHYALQKNDAQSSGAMWKLLEAYPSDPMIKSYARWYFASSGDFNACFSIDATDNNAEDAFYEGIRSAVQGYSTAALRNFSQAEKDTGYTAAAVLNQASIYAARNEPDMAIRYFTQAADILPETKLKSKALYEAAQIYAERNGISEAIVLLNRALELDPENYRANVLKQKLKDDGSINRYSGLAPASQDIKR